MTPEQTSGDQKIAITSVLCRAESHTQMEQFTLTSIYGVVHCGRSPSPYRASLKPSFWDAFICRHGCTVVDRVVGEEHGDPHETSCLTIWSDI